MESMRRFALYAAVILCVCGLSASLAAERFGQWSLEQPDDFIFALSFKRSISFDDSTATSQLAFVCNRAKKDVAVLLIPLDGTFTTRHGAIPIAIRKIEEKSDQSDLMQRWENGPGYIFLQPPDEQEELALYLKDREAEGVKSVHFYFPNDLDASTWTTNHISIDLAGFPDGVAAFTKRCEQAQ
jgi:hypothetical protein